MNELGENQARQLTKKIQTGQLTPQEAEEFKRILVDTRVALSKNQLASKLIEIKPKWARIYEKLTPKERDVIAEETVVYIDADNWVIYVNNDVFPKEFQKYAAIHEAEEHVSRTLAGAKPNANDEYHIGGLRTEYKKAQEDGHLIPYHNFWRELLHKQTLRHTGTKLEETAKIITNQYLQERESMFTESNQP